MPEACMLLAFGMKLCCSWISTGSVVGPEALPSQTNKACVKQQTHEATSAQRFVFIKHAFGNWPLSECKLDNADAMISNREGT